MTDTTIKKLVTYEDSVSHEQKVLTNNGVPVTTNINLEEASVQIANATTEITPSSQYDGLSKVTTTVPIRTSLSGTGVRDTITIPNITVTGVSLNQNSGNGILNITTQATPVFKAQDFVVYNNLSGMNGTSKSQTLNVNLQDYLIASPNVIDHNENNINVTNYKTISVNVSGAGPDVSGVTATAPDVANSKVFVDSNGQNVTGSMNLTNLTITPSNTQQTWDNYNQVGNYTCYKKIICKPQAGSAVTTGYLSSINFEKGSSKTFSLGNTNKDKTLLALAFFAKLSLDDDYYNPGNAHVLLNGYFYNSQGFNINTTYSGRAFYVNSDASNTVYADGPTQNISLTINSNLTSITLSTSWGRFSYDYDILYVCKD